MLCVFLDSQIGKDKAPMVESASVEPSASIIFEVPKMDDISIPKFSDVQLEQVFNNEENAEIGAPTMQPTSKETEKSAHEPLLITTATSSSEMLRNLYIQLYWI